MSLTFDPQGHVYRYEGVIVPSVTQILAPWSDYSKIPPDRLEIARQEGNAMHGMVDMDVKHVLDVAALPEWLQPRYTAWVRFCADTGFVPVQSEVRRYCKRIRVAGTDDLEGSFKRAPHRLAVIDVKRSFYAGRTIGLQTAGYEVLIESENPGVRVRERGCLQLRADGSYRYESSDDPNSKIFSAMDRTVFLAAVTVHKWRNAT